MAVSFRALPGVGAIFHPGRVFQVAMYITSLYHIPQQLQATW